MRKHSHNSTTSRRPIQRSPPSVGGSLAMLLAVFAIAVGSLLAIEYPVGVIAVLAATGAVGVVVRSLTGWLSSPSSRAASLRQRVRFGRRPRYRQ
ncbi:MAG: hypothetical protein A07HR67_00550 [uncultured archaeon A07HR67]|nr:MAG: hypothetical protein A07HR67_00550 [uncultured archaeon A07HR67]